MPHLPEYRTAPPGLATKTQLKARHLVPTGDPVALLVYRCPAGGFRRAPLYELATARDAKAAEAARKHRMAEIHGQSPLF